MIGLIPLLVANLKNLTAAKMLLKSLIASDSNCNSFAKET
jgi:hypothetical protein